MLFDRNVSFVALVALGMCFPSGLSRFFLPSVSVSSVYDYNQVMVPVVSFQAILMLGYILFSNGRLRLSISSIGFLLVLGATSLVSGMLSLNPGGYYSYSLLWLFGGLAVAKFIQNGRPGSVDVFDLMALLAMIFFPAFVLDFAVSYMFSGLDGFSSFMFASNGHSFVSFFLFLCLVLARLRTGVMPTAPAFYQNLAMLVYFLGGVASQGRVALLACLMAWAMLIGRRALFYSLFALPLLVWMGLESDKLRTTFFALMDLDFDDRVAWSSMFSRLEFWDVFVDVFVANPVAGAGGLAVNIAKFDYGFGFDVFVDPHNEFVYLLSGFGLSGVFMVIGFLYFIRKQSAGTSSMIFERDIRFRSFAFFVYIFICSITNANSAKQNIQILIVFVLGMLVANFSSASGSRKFFIRN